MSLLSMRFFPRVTRATATTVLVATTMSNNTRTAAYHVAVVGGGVAGCAAARSLALAASDDTEKLVVTVHEIGRGPGGRASTRTTRSAPAMRINHGAPYADVTTAAGRALVRYLELPAFDGRRGRLSARDGSFVEDAVNDDDTRCVTGRDGDMAHVASALLADAANHSNDNVDVETKYSSMVRGLSRDDAGRWLLHDKTDAVVSEPADWLIVAGSGVAHPRWTHTFGGEPPLVAAAGALDSTTLNDALATIAKQEATPVLAVFFYGTGAAARSWAGLPWRVGEIEDDDILAKIVVRPDEHGDGCSVVVHSTTAFATDPDHVGVYGSSSSAARVGDASSDSSKEDVVAARLLEALARVPGLPAVPHDCAYGPMLHRWGNAFPTGAPLPEPLCCDATSRVGFCGDYVETKARMGSVESALLSGTRLGERIAALLNDGAVKDA